MIRQTFLYFGLVKFKFKNIAVTVQAGLDMAADYNVVSRNLLSLLGNPPNIQAGLYKLRFSIWPRGEVLEYLDPPLILFSEPEVFKVDPEAKHDVVFGYDFFNFQGKEVVVDAQTWHIIYEEFAIARLQTKTLGTVVRGRRHSSVRDVSANTCFSAL